MQKMLIYNILNMKASERYKLREGFTTGSAATAAIIGALKGLYLNKIEAHIIVKAPAGTIYVPTNYVTFNSQLSICSIIKDGGDDPDCTHGIEILAYVYKKNSFLSKENLIFLNLSDCFEFYSGVGIGVVTLEGLSIKIGEPAINPVPRLMIKENVEIFLKTYSIKEKPYIVLSVPKGAEIAKHTLNDRLGIVNGISILGTTGIVKPVSMEAFTATIDISLNLARSKDLKKIVLSFGRQSEMSAENFLSLPKESYILIGDFFRYAIEKAKSMGFEIILSGQPGKILKAAMDIDNTNVKYGIFSIKDTLIFLSTLGVLREDLKKIENAKTARHLFELSCINKINIWDRVVNFLAKKEKIGVMLFSYSGDLIARA